MGSDSGLSRGCGCPEKCEARAMRWQERAGCQSKKVALIQRKGKESACQARSAEPSARRGDGERVRVRRKVGRKNLGYEKGGEVSESRAAARWEIVWDRRTGRAVN